MFVTDDVVLFIEVIKNWILAMLGMMLFDVGANNINIDGIRMMLPL